jgi:chromate transport protein ChrA
MILKATGDTMAVGAIIGTFLGWLPSIAAILSILWFIVQLYESQTGQRIFTWLRSLFQRKI